MLGTSGTPATSAEGVLREGGGPGPPGAAATRVEPPAAAGRRPATSSAARGRGGGGCVGRARGPVKMVNSERAARPGPRPARAPPPRRLFFRPPPPGKRTSAQRASPAAVLGAPRTAPAPALPLGPRWGASSQWPARVLVVHSRGAGPKRGIPAARGAAGPRPNLFRPSLRPFASAVERGSRPGPSRPYALGYLRGDRRPSLTGLLSKGSTGCSVQTRVLTPSDSGTPQGLSLSHRPVNGYLPGDVRTLSSRDCGP